MRLTDGLLGCLIGLKCGKALGCRCLLLLKLAKAFRDRDQGLLRLLPFLAGRLLLLLPVLLLRLKLRQLPLLLHIVGLAQLPHLLLQRIELGRGRL